MLTLVILALAASSLATKSRLDSRSTTADPLLVLPYSTFAGVTADGVDSFKGMPFAQPPIGDLRLRYPVVPPKSATGIIPAKDYGPSCIQQITYNGNFSNFPQSTLKIFVPTLKGIGPTSEDCLTINVQMPKGTKATDKLPIVAWIYGGAFEIGGTVQYDGSPIVQRSVVMGTPIIFVSMNYRLNAFGFLVGAAGVGNLGLVDQREGLKWINKYAHLFGGDSSKVTIWGESAGAVSVGSQMVTNKGNPEGLFSSAFSQSGSALPSSTIEDYQPNFDKLARDVGCQNHSTPLDCIRAAPADAIIKSVNSSPTIFSYPGLNFFWAPAKDGKFLTANPQALVLKGEYAKVPYIISDCDDEGSLFSATMPNVTTDDDFKEFVKQIYLPKATDDEIDSLLVAYPNDTSVGSPFDTGNLNAFTPQFKRIAALQGDINFQATRRFFLSIASQTQPVWSYLWKRDKAVPYLGSAHEQDLEKEFFMPGIGSVDKQLIDYLIRFVVTKDPNDSSNPNLINWPQWKNSSRVNLELIDRPPGRLIGSHGLTTGPDDYRQSEMELVTKLFLKYPFSTTYK